MEKFSKIEWFVMIGCAVSTAASFYVLIWFFLALGSM
jgi:hypothetical protein